MTPAEIRKRIEEQKAKYRPQTTGPQPPPDPRYSRVDMAAEVFRSESDRGCVLFAAALLDESLENLIRSHLERNDPGRRKLVDKMFEPMGPIGTSSAKIKFAYLLNLICKEAYEALESLRMARNAFAHSPEPMDLTHVSVFDHYRNFLAHFKLSGAPLADFKDAHKIPLVIAVAGLEGYMDSCARSGSAAPWATFPG